MSGLAPIHHKTLEKFLLSVGCKFVRQKGSHRVYWRDDQLRPIVVPTYKQVPVFVIRNILRQLSIAPEEFSRLVKEL